MDLLCDVTQWDVYISWLLMLMEGFPVSGLREINLLLNLRHDNIVPLTEIVVGKRLDRYVFTSVFFCLHIIHGLGVCQPVYHAVSR